MYLIKAFGRAVESKIRRAIFSPRRWIKRQLIKEDRKIVHLGTDYGGWSHIVTDGLNSKHAILCGAGEDITFDIELQKIYDCEIFILDPTPRAQLHFAELIRSASLGLKFVVGGPSNFAYNLDGVNTKKLTFIPTAIWTEQCKIKFWSPHNPKHVSHSAVNNQKSDSFITVDADNMINISKKYGIDLKKVSIIKLDIEGAELIIVDWLLSNNIYPDQFLIEFDELNIPNRKSSQKVKFCFQQLKENGYKLVQYDGNRNCTFVRESNFDNELISNSTKLPPP
jgi:hypothetical protein